MVIQCASCENVMNENSESCPFCHSGNLVLGYIDDKIIPIVVKTKREDGEINTCIIEMPESFLERDQYDDTYDELLWEKIEEKIYFEGLGYVLIETRKWEMI